jgi:hypothetical protein
LNCVSWLRIKTNEMSKIIDLTGQEFGKLTALSKIETCPETINKRAIWECICQCGNKSVVPSYQLRSGKTKSCGCLRNGDSLKKYNKSKYLNLIGQKIGKLTILSRRENGKIAWNCKCDCGKDILVSQEKFNRFKKIDEIISCGCSNKKLTWIIKHKTQVPWTEEEKELLRQNAPTKTIDELSKIIPLHSKSAIRNKQRSLGIKVTEETKLKIFKNNFSKIKKTRLINLNGLRVGNLRVIRRSENIENHHQVHWDCLCDCGSIKSIRGERLRKNNVRSCGCISKSRGDAHRCWRGFGKIPLRFFNVIKKRAEKMDKEFSITIEELDSLLIKQNNQCALTGLTIKIGNTREETTASVDRIDSSKGYIKDNIQFLHKDINFMKLDYNQTQFIEYCRLVANHNP